MECRKALQEFPCVLFGGARGGGKSRLARNIAVEYAYKYPGISVAIFRRTYTELQDNHIRKFMEEFTDLEPFWLAQRKQFEVPNGSTISLRYCDKEDDLGKYKGAEFQILIIDEADAWPPAWVIRLKGANRSSNKKFPVRTLFCANPGGLCHQYLKRLFVQRDFEPGENPDDYVFISAKLSDNPALEEADPGYRAKLEAEPNEAIRRAYIDGDWDVFSGQAFTEFHRGVHVIEDFTKENPIPANWPRYGSMDWGYSHCLVFHWFAISEDGTVYLYRELVTRKEKPDEVLNRLFEYDDTRLLQYVVAGHDCFSKMKDGTSSIEEQFSPVEGDKRIFLTPCVYDRVQGWSQMRAYLGYKDLPGRRLGPKLFITKCCQLTIDGIERAQIDPSKMEDIMKVNCQENNPIGSGDDQIDSLRYFLMSRPFIAAFEKPEVKLDRWERKRRQREGEAKSWRVV